jgi:hypothetical protein
MIAMEPKVEYLSCAETAKLVRAALKKVFPRVKFSVRSSTYSMGASISVRWTDGPSSKAVDKVIEAYAGADFDGMIDLKYDKKHVLMPDGSAILAYSPGTEGSMGSHPKVKGPSELAEIVQGARLVDFGADYVHSQRTLSDGARETVEAWVAAHETDEGKGRSYCPNPLEGGMGRSDWKTSHTWFAAEMLARRADVATGALSAEEALR